MRRNSVSFNRYGGASKDYVEKYVASSAVLLLPFLLQKIESQSRTSVKSYLAHGCVKVGGRVTTHFDEPLHEGDVVEVNFTRPFVMLSHPMVRLLWEDKDLIVIEKRSGLLSVPTGHNRDEKSALEVVDAYVHLTDGRSHAYVCHRIDRFTSGVLVFAKNEAMQHTLRDEWQTYIVERRYMAICEHTPEHEEGEVRSYLAENAAMKVYSTPNPEEGKLAVTRYWVKARKGMYSQVDVQILTGRKNQIRVHLSEMGCPIAGDMKYGAVTNPFRRMMLHNYLLELVHPVTREHLHFELPLPASFIL